jgi:signal transduction histidine kinase
VSRLFLKVYLGIAVVLVIGSLGTLYVATRGLDDVRQRVLDERLLDSAEYVRNRIESEDLFNEEELLFELSRAARLAFRILPPEDGLPDAIRVRLAESDEALLHREPGAPPLIYARFEDGQILEGRPGRRWGGDRFRGDASSRPPGPPRDGRLGFDPRQRGPGGGDGFDQFRDRRLHARNLFLLSVIGIPILLVGPAIYFLIRPLDRRIGALTAVAERFGEGDLDSRASEDGVDALGELMGTFNRMADQIKGLIDGQNELLRAVSHELRTPLARLFFMLDDAEAAESHEEKKKHLQRIQNTLTGMNELVEELLTFVRLDQEGEQINREVLLIREVVEELPEIVADLRPEVRVEVLCGDETVRMVPRLFKRAVLNLLTNAVRHAESRVVVRSWETGGATLLAVDDDGPGVPPAHRERILKPFIRVDESRNSKIGGIGLGLAIVSRIVNAHEGSVEVGASPEGGARFLLRFSSS